MYWEIMDEEFEQLTETEESCQQLLDKLDEYKKYLESEIIKKGVK